MTGNAAAPSFLKSAPRNANGAIKANATAPMTMKRSANTIPLIILGRFLSIKAEHLLDLIFLIRTANAPDSPTFAVRDKYRRFIVGGLAALRDLICEHRRLVS